MMVFLTSLLSAADFPAIVLLLLLLLLVFIAAKAQERADFDWGQAFQDENGKVSALRVAVFVANIVSSWVLIAVTMKTIIVADDLKNLYPVYGIYLICWVLPKLAEKALDIIMFKLGIK